MESTRMQMEMHEANPWPYYKLSLNALAVVLKCGITIASPDPKADTKLHVWPTLAHPGGTFKVIIVSQHHKSIDSRPASHELAR